MSTIVIRADANVEIGFGHVGRCLTLAHALRARGHEARFVCRSVSPGFAERIRVEGFELLVPPPLDREDAGDLAHSAWLGVSQAADAEATLAVAGGFDAVVVDHYALDARWESRVGAGCAVLAIDDLTDRRHACDVLLNQNPTHADAYSALVSERARVCLGPHYALLRPEFIEARKLAEVRESARGVVVFLGGADGSGATLFVLDALDADRVRSLDLDVDVLVGSANPARDVIENRCRVAGYRVHVDSVEIPRLLGEADLAVGAAGSSAWERACVGLPTIMLCVAENQRPIAQSVDALGVGVYAGDLGSLSAGRLAERIADVAQQGLDSMSRRAFDLVDGGGCSRVADAFEAAL